jgi:hypothetical protein
MSVRSPFTYYSLFQPEPYYHSQASSINYQYIFAAKEVGLSSLVLMSICRAPVRRPYDNIGYVSVEAWRYRLLMIAACTGFQTETIKALQL